MKLCPQCEFIYEDDQKFCDMDGQELVHDPRPRAFTDNTAALPSLSQVLKSEHAAPQSEHATAPVTKIHIPLPGPMPSPAANAAAAVAPRPSSRWQTRGLAIAALAGLALVALLFVVYYARAQSQTRKANRSSSQATESAGQSQAQPATQSAAQSAAPVASGSAAPLNEAPASEQTLDQASSDQAADADLTGPTTLQASSSLANGSDKSVSRVRQTSTLVAAHASSETGRAPVIIRLNNGASIKADEAWEKKEGVWYRQAGMVTFLKRSRVRSIQRPASTRSQTEPNAERSFAQNQPRVGKPDAANSKKDSKVTSFLKTTGRVLKKPFKF